MSVSNYIVKDCIAYVAISSTLLPLSHELHASCNKSRLIVPALDSFQIL